jgi:hypothetical protein
MHNCAIKLLHFAQSLWFRFLYLGRSLLRHDANRRGIED